MNEKLYLAPQTWRIADIRAALPELRRLLGQYDVRLAYIFGSVLHDGNNSARDLDLAVLPAPNQTDALAYYNDLHAALVRFFGADNVDLVLLDKAPLSLKAQAILQGLLLISEGRDALAFQEQVLARYLDLASWRQENWALTKQLARQGLATEVNMIDQSRVERFVFLIRDAVRELLNLQLAEMSFDVYQADKQTRALSEHYLRLALEALLDLGRHIVVRTGLGIPQEYRDVGRILREQGVLPPELARELEAMAGMRNVLVHLYWDINYLLLYDVITGKPDHFERIVTHFFDFLETDVE